MGAPPCGWCERFRAPDPIGEAHKSVSKRRDNMGEDPHDDRRCFLGLTAMTMAAAHLGTRDVAHAQPRQTQPSEGSTRQPHTNTAFGPVTQIEAGLLHVGYGEVGAANSRAVLLLHGWPYDIYGSFDVAPELASAGYRVIVSCLRGYGPTRFLAHATPRNGRQSVRAVGITYHANKNAPKKER